MDDNHRQAGAAVVDGQASAVVDGQDSAVVDGKDAAVEDEERQEKMVFSQRFVKYGDTCIIYVNPVNISYIIVTPGHVLQNAYGKFPHDKLVGLPYGSKVSSTSNLDMASNKSRQKTGNRPGFIYILALTPELWSKSMNFRTQILYTTDCSMITFHLHLKPGSIVYESGTGSGSLTSSLIRAVAPLGHVHTFEYDANRAIEARVDFENIHAKEYVTVYHGDVCTENGFSGSLSTLMEDPVRKHPGVLADAFFLDLPTPWLAIPHARKLLKSGGRICSFSPCIEQVQRASLSLAQQGFENIRTFECLTREIFVRNVSLKVPKSALPEKETVIPAPTTSKRLRDDTVEEEEEEEEKNDNIKKRRGKHDPASLKSDQVALDPMPVSYIQGKSSGHTGYLTFASYFGDL